MIEIPLTRGYVALVDDVDADLADHKWHAAISEGRAYAVRKIGSHRRSKMHREIMNPPVGLDVDHIDGNGLNNQRANLRIATDRQNQYNAPDRPGPRVFPYLDRDGNRDKWRAQIWHEGKKVSVGVFLTEEDARLAHAFCAYHLREGFAPIERPPDFDMTKLGPSMQARLARLITGIVTPESRPCDGGEKR